MISTLTQSSDRNLIVATNIYEYDIRKANISVLYEAGVLSADKYNELYEADRMVRQVYIGKLQKSDDKITKALQKGIATAREKFMRLNNIEENNIIRISNDAVYSHSVEINHTKMSEHVEFVLKNEFTSYMKVGKYEFFYMFDQVNGVERYKVLGINDIECHHNSFIQLILAIFSVLELDGYEAAHRAVWDIIESYENRVYPIEFYREFNHSHMFRLYNDFQSECLKDDEFSAKTVDIEYNLDILYAIKNIILREMI